ncbi:hypothetical protein BDV23DRAFT_3197 [Aspergillus alliaceus]|uniref:Uncharacterized protein n=1 Tax=Petromyces alliaceus TaxID=209559 RepID=A0A5N7CSK7_PETAA|nr:uncharacterized protein BDW43DRAFT_84521 [Aspergillus alliaceus]KAB8233686.1 hypothetical protein BDW43DRAFT_84521 [Aspergillus alliaceus]KAE8396657.1 hypothetical protein BDV23DRAFT_3197 [Aspergillus alliaceus]
MAICITFGTHEFTSMLEGYENVRAYCYNCQHWNGHCVTRWPWFTVCFIPMIPLATHKYKEVICHTCRFTQDLRDQATAGCTIWTSATSTGLLGTSSSGFWGKWISPARTTAAELSA